MIYLKPPSNFKPKFEVVSCYLQFNNKILLLKRHSQKPEGNTWCVPAGKLKSAESLQAAIIRELKEETNINFSIKGLKYFKKVYVRYPTYDFIYHIFKIELKSISDLNIKIDPKEHTKYIWEEPKKALKMPLIQDEDLCFKLLYKV